MKRLSLLFARRYLFSKKSHSVINIISGVSAFSVGIPVAAMVILLSIFNGLEDLVKSMYNDFDPDILITATQGKVFDEDAIDKNQILDINGVNGISSVLEDNAMLEYRGRQFIGTVRGVDSLYENVIPVQNMVVQGEFKLMFGDMPQAFVGQGVAYNLGVRPEFYDRIYLYVPKRGGSFSSLLPLDSFTKESVFPSGIFALEAQTDSKYMITTIDLAQELFDYRGKVSGMMVSLEKGVNPDKARSAISEKIGKDYNVKTRYQQKASLYKMMIYEKWAIFFIILLVLIIASFSVIGSLAMLIIDKRKDIRTLITFGGSAKFIRSIFVNEGMLISMVGSAAGLIIGLVFCVIQQQFGLIDFPGDTFMVSSYPVIIKLTDLIGVIVAFTVINYIIAKFTVIKMIPKSAIRI